MATTPAADACAPEDEIVGTCTDCKLPVTAYDNAQDGEHIFCIRCRRKSFNQGITQAKSLEAFNQLLKPFVLAYGKEIIPSLRTLTAVTLDLPAARAYLNALEAKLRQTPRLNLRLRHDALTALQHARNLLA
ncbi:MAG: hypothetical protein WA001_05265 [Patescibacteria group bacterium]